MLYSGVRLSPTCDSADVISDCSAPSGDPASTLWVNQNDL